MAGPYFCASVGTGIHRNVLKAYGTAWGLETSECSDGETICLGIGTGGVAAVHESFLTTYAEENDLDHQTSETACP